MTGREVTHTTKQGAVSHLVHRSNGAHVLGTNGGNSGPHAISQSIRQQQQQ